ncbi:MAG: hypothetical protein ONA90_08540, partial [candidate division KSB1 bacterium]|nr:hypothetical protein [candidate division KSB1 bacterium]
MKKAMLALGVLAALVASTRAKEMSVISGTLLGHDGKPMRKAQIQLLPREFDRQALQVVEVAEDGSFEIQFNHTGLLYLNFTGVDHYEHTVPLLVEKPLREKFSVRLRLYEYAENLSNISIIGDFNNFNFRSARPMVKQPDGTFIFEMDTTASTFAYQILGAEKTGRSINGTQSEDFTYDGGGDYHSVVK